VLTRTIRRASCDLILDCYAASAVGGPIAKGRRKPVCVSLIESANGLSAGVTVIVAPAIPWGVDGSALKALPVQSPGQLHNAADFSCD
jgi:hypothetical protein